MKIKIKGVIVSNEDKRIYDWFEMDATCPKDVETQIESAKDEDLEVIINSVGGDVHSGSEIYTILKEYKGNVTVKITGIAASAASVIAMAGKKVIMSPTAQLMIHKASILSWGNHKELERSVELLKSHDEGIANAYMLKTGMNKEELLNLMDAETYFSAKKAKELNFIDEIMFDDELKLSASARGMLPPEVIDKVRNLIKTSDEPKGSFLIHKQEPQPVPVDLYKNKISLNERRIKGYEL